jgi:hypothetical protein
MKVFSRLFPALAALCLLTACGGQAKRTALHNSVDAVEAEGYIPYNERDLIANARAAAVEAQKSAIETVADLFISPLAKAERSDVLKKTLLKSPQLYVKRYKVLGERREGDFYRVSIRAYVYVDRIASALRGLAMTEPAGPGVAGALMLDEYLGPAASAYGDARKAFTDYLGRKTVLKFLDAPALNNSKDENAFFEAARASGADLVLIGRAEAAPLAAAQGQQAGFYTTRARTELKIYEAGSRKLMLELAGNSNALDVTEEGAFRKALTSAGELLGQEAFSKADKFIKPAAPLVLRVRGLNGIADAHKLKDAIYKAGASRADFESYSDGEAVITVYPAHPDAQEFSSALLRTGILNLAIESVSQFEAVFSVM